MKRGLIIAFLFGLFSSLLFVSADITVSPTSFSEEIYEVSSYTITISNPDTYLDTGANTNITNVSIIFPSGLTFISGTNSTSSLSIFSSSSSVLSWYNNSVGGYVVGSATGGENSKTFSFNLNATSLTTFNVTIRTHNNTGDFDFGVSFKINDTTLPTATLNDPEDNEDDTDGVLVFDCNAADNYDLDSIALYVWNSSDSSEVYSSILSTSGISNQTDFDYTFSSNGEYDWNCFANDTMGNFDWGSNRTLTISVASACVPDWECDDWSSCLNETQTTTCIDLNSCGNNSTKPAEIQTCVIECTPDWDCTDWAPIECPESGQQTKTCVDKNECDSNVGKSPEKKACTYQSNSSWIFIAVIGGLIFLGGVAGLVFYFRSKPQDNFNMPASTTQNYTGNNYGEVSGNSQGYTYKYS